MDLRHPRPFVFGALGLMTLGVLAAGCGLLDLEKFRKVKFDIPQVTASVDTDDARWKVPPAQSVPAVACGPDQPVQDCCAPPAPAPAFDCVTYPLVCESRACAYKLPYEGVQTIDLKKMVPALASVEADALTEVVIQTLTYRVKNDLNVPLPPVRVFIAPATVSTSAGQTELFATEQVPAGATVTRTVQLTPAAQSAFSNYATKFNTPFNIISATIVTITGGSAPPQGRAEVTVSGQGEARF